MIPRLIAAAPLMAPGSVRAAEQDFSAGIVPIVLNLLLVLAVIFVIAWLVKRSPLAGKSNGQLTVMSTLALGQRERLVLVQFAGRELLLGINGQSITLLSEAVADEDAAAPPQHEPRQPFAEFLRRSG